MRVLIDLNDSILSKVESLAKKEQRSRKQMIELLVERSV